MPMVRELIGVLQTAYPPELAEDWDAVGLVCGDPEDEVERVLVCVDPVQATVAEAEELGAHLVVAHHPLLLRGVSSVAADTRKGKLVHRMIRNGIALYCAHTNADSANPGVSDALAEAIGLTELRPLNPHPLAEPEEPIGIGRIGELPAPMTLREFTKQVAAALPPTEPGVLAAGDPDRQIRTVAVSGGAGDSYLSVATRARVDAFVTADLRHHPASEHLADGDVPALIGVTHWASEWPWCEQAADVIRAACEGTVEVHVSRRNTDPWTMRVGEQGGIRSEG